MRRLTHLPPSWTLFLCALKAVVCNGEKALFQLAAVRHQLSDFDSYSMAFRTMVLSFPSPCVQVTDKIAVMQGRGDHVYECSRSASLVTLYSVCYDETQGVYLPLF